VARVRLRRPAVELEQRAEDLRGGTGEPGRARQRARHRPAQLVGVADRPHEAGFLDVLARHVQAEDGPRNVAAVAVEGGEFLARDVLAAGDPVGVRDDELHGLDVWVALEKGCQLPGPAVEGVARWDWIHAPGFRRDRGMVTDAATKWQAHAPPHTRSPA
jgi:hypothetical protein